MVLHCKLEKNHINNNNAKTLLALLLPNSFLLLFSKSNNTLNVKHLKPFTSFTKEEICGIYYETFTNVSVCFYWNLNLKNVSLSKWMPSSTVVVKLTLQPVPQFSFILNQFLIHFCELQVRWRLLLHWFMGHENPFSLQRQTKGIDVSWLIAGNTCWEI